MSDPAKLADPAHGLRGRARHQPRHHDRQRRAAEHLARARRPAPASCSGSSTATTSPSPALVLAAGSLSDRFGRRPALILGLVGFAAASAAGALVTSAEALVAARFAMGAFAALIFPTTLSIISNTFRERKRARGRARHLGRRRRARRRGRPGHRRAAARALLLGQRLLGAGPARAGDRRGGVRCWCPSRATRRCRRSTCPASGCRSRCWRTLTYTIIEAPDARLGARRRRWAASRSAPLLLVAFVVRRAPDAAPDARRRRCSATAGSAPPAER